MRVLLVEDDALLGAGLERGLEALGMNVAWAREAAAASRLLRSEPFDAVVLDLGLPNEDGMHALGRWRAEGLTTPVLILTARDALSDRIAGLDEGADDYVVKPAPLEEIAARLRALVRRGEGRSRSLIDLGRLRLDTAGHAVWFDGSPVELSAMEYRLLERLARSPGRVFTKIQLEQALYEADEAPDSNVLQVLIHHLRRKIDPDIIDTVRGLGYRLGPAAQGAAR
ncbi:MULTISPECIES: response regulator [Tepidiphilus]|uniref:Response regulator n=1 Tax=Tepidiphilus baoligensis TaxID=2698687 RepID=A0ABX1QLB3_9PROT|nr:MULTISPECIES: response regulator [Tepidiphilus]NMH16095.1 response regulator [Tepidiphilus baoligensis]